MSGAEPARKGGWSPFSIFGVGILVAAAWGIYMGLAYAGTPTFVSAALPTIAGVSVAVAAILIIGARSPPNE